MAFMGPLSRTPILSIAPRDPVCLRPVVAPDDRRHVGGSAPPIITTRAAITSTSTTASPARPPTPTGEPSFWQRMTSNVTGDTSRVSMPRRFLSETAGQLALPGSLWCADFVDNVERLLGRRGTGCRSRTADTGPAGPQIGAIATMGRRGGDHVGIVTAYDAHTVTLISGNSYGRRVYEGAVDRRRIPTYAM
jgi:hypothetical protein